MFDKLPSESRSSAEIRNYLAFQEIEQAAGVKEQASNVNVVSGIFSYFSAFRVKQTTAARRPSYLEFYI